MMNVTDEERALWEGSQQKCDAGRKQKATAAMIKIVQLLESEQFTVLEARRVLDAVYDVLEAPFNALRTKTQVFIPEEIEWGTLVKLYEPPTSKIPSV
jgi:hypothetical protein